MSEEQELGRLLDEQRAYYQAFAPHYLSQELDLPGYGELAEALEEFRPAGSVLELACGPGVWTSSSKALAQAPSAAAPRTAPPAGS